MRRQIGVAILLLALAVCASSCIGGVSVGDLYGTWIAKYPNGNEELVLKPDGTYHQTVNITGYPELTREDRWRFDGDALWLQGQPARPYNADGHFMQYFDIPTDGPLIYEVGRLPVLAISIDQSEDIWYTKQ
jgi:hypothetical protein